MENKEDWKLIIQYGSKWVPKALCTINRFGEADDCEGCREHCEYLLELCETEGDCDGCAIQECFDRLAEYEKTGLMPENMEDK